MPWQPTRLLRLVQTHDTSMGTTQWKTDATFAFVKTLGNRAGEHALASEYVASALASWFGLTVPDFAIVSLPDDLCYPLPRGAKAEPGPAFASRLVEGRTWGGSADELHALVNPEDVTGLVVFDTWVRNRDRYPPNIATRKANYGNVFLADVEKPEGVRLCAIDHTHCFDNEEEFTKRLLDIDRVKDDRTFGLFPPFSPFITPSRLHDCRVKLLTLQRRDVDGIIDLIPSEWQVDTEQKANLAELILRRATYIADRIESGWQPKNPIAEEDEP